MDNLIDTAYIFRYHRDMVAAHSNTDHRALGWLNLQSQLTRFEILAQIASLNNCSVLDAGCGHGDMSAFLRSIYPDVRYYGVEQIPEFLDLAVKRYGNIPETVFYQGDFLRSQLPTVDYVLVSGSLNYCSTDPDFIFKAIEKLFCCSRLGFGFNLLNHTTDGNSLTAYNPDEILNFCSTLSGNTMCFDNYVDDDFTVFMYK